MMNKLTFIPRTDEERRARRWNKIIDVVSGIANAVGVISILAALYMVLYIYDVNTLGLAEGEYFVRVMALLGVGSLFIIL